MNAFLVYAGFVCTLAILAIIDLIQWEKEWRKNYGIE